MQERNSVTPEKPITGFASIDRPWLQYYKEDFCPSIPHVSIYDYIYQQNEKRLDSYALNYYHHKISYRELFAKADALATSLKRLGINKGEHVPLCSLTTPEMIISFLALNKIGAIPNMISPINGSERLKQHIISTNARFLITLDIFTDKINGVINETQIQTVIVFHFASSMYGMERMIVSTKLRFELPKIHFSGNVLQGEKLMKMNNAEETRSEQFTESSVAVIVYTSGSTGKPKAIMLSNKNFVAMMIQYSKMDIIMNPGETFMSVIPPFFPYGICNSICVPLSLGLETILIPKFDASLFPKVFMDYRPNHVNGVPKYWESLMTDPISKDADISFLKNAGCGGAGITNEKEMEIVAYFQSHGSTSMLNKGYGASEVTSAATVATLKSNEVGSAGIPLIYTDISIFKYDTDEELPYLDSKEGEICISGPTIMIGYQGDEEKTKKVIKRHKDGRLWYHTRDKGHMAPDGAVFIHGRYDRLILRRGMSIDPADIEYELSKHSLVQEVAVIKMEHPDLVEVPVACVVLSSDGFSTKDAIKELYAQCAKTLPEYSWPYRIIIINKIPKLEGDKTDYQSLKNYAMTVEES